MLSRRFVWLLLASLASCRAQEDVIADLCGKLEDCVGVEPLECSHRLEEAVTDRRLSTAGLAQCSDCVVKNDCGDVLDERDCDKPCADIAIVTNARTGSETRKHACNTVRTACMDRSDEGTCTTSLSETLKHDASFAVDVEIDACLGCLVLNGKEAHAEAGEGGAGAAGAPGTPPSQCAPSDERAGGAGGDAPVPMFEGLALCSSLIDRCSLACAKIEAFSSALERAAGALAVCSRGEACLTSGAPSNNGGEAGLGGGAGGTDGGGTTSGASATSGEGGAGGSGECVPVDPNAGQTAFERCYDRLYDSTRATQVKECSVCLSDNFDCVAASITCRSECATLFSAP
jgi:hypothetical protein